MTQFQVLNVSPQLKRSSSSIPLNISEGSRIRTVAATATVSVLGKSIF